MVELLMSFMVMVAMFCLASLVCERGPLRQADDEVRHQKKAN